MNSSYLDDYKIIQTFKENKFQKVFVGADKVNNQAVVINRIYTRDNDYEWKVEDQDYKSIFDNLVHFERSHNEMTIITRVGEGLSLNEYLNKFEPSFTERVALIYQYLNGIKKYDPLPDNTKSILVDESQIIMMDHDMTFGELIIFNDDSFYTENFKTVKNNIISMLQKLTSLPNIAYGELPLYIKIMGFIDEVRKNDEDYRSIEKILDDFIGLNYEKTINPIEESAFTAEIASSSNRPLSIAIGAAGIATIILTGLFVFKSILPLNKDMGSNINAPNNILDLHKDDLVHNENNRDILASSDRIIEPNDNINYVSEYIEKDFATSKYSDYSFKISSDRSESHRISIDSDSIEAGSQFLIWIKSSTDDEVKLKVEGYSNGDMSLRQSMVHKPLDVNKWELVQFTLNKSIDGPIDVIFDDISSTIWVGKISIDFFK